MLQHYQIFRNEPQHVLVRPRQQDCDAPGRSGRSGGNDDAAECAVVVVPEGTRVTIFSRGSIFNFKMRLHFSCLILGNLTGTAIRMSWREH